MRFQKRVGIMHARTDLRVGDIVPADCTHRGRLHQHRLIRINGRIVAGSKKRCLFQPLRAPSSVWREAALLVMRVHELAPEKVWSTRYGEINQFEKLIVGQNKTTILKFFLHIFKEERLTRFAKRVDDPARQWKISESDYKERDYWDDYVEAFEDVPGENEHRARALVRDSFKS